MNNSSGTYTNVTRRKNSHRSYRGNVAIVAIVYANRELAFFVVANSIVGKLHQPQRADLSA